MVFVGVDPGKSGAIVVYRRGDIEGITWEVTGKDLYDAIIKFCPSHVFIEKAQSMPRQGIASAFSYGTGYGGLISAADIAKAPYTLISPRIWCAKMHLGCTGETPKEKSAKAFSRLFPKWIETIKNRNGRLHEGVVDAALIAAYGARYVLNF